MTFHDMLPQAFRIARLSAMAALLASPAIPQGDMATDSGPDAATGAQDATPVDIARWSAAASYYDGWSAEALLDEDAIGATGEEIGEIEDIIVGPDGRIRRVVVEGGGFLDIGDTHAAVPWEEVTRIGAGSITVPLTEDNLDDYTRFPEVDDMPAMGENFRVNEVIGDYVSADGVGYGTVEDVIFSQDGRIEALIVYPAYGYGYRPGPIAMPYDARGYNRMGTTYEAPYATTTLDALRPFDYGEVGY